MHIHVLAAVLALGATAGSVTAQQPPADLIVQFQQPESGGRMRLTANAMTSRRDALETRLTDLRRDLARLDGARRTTIASAAIADAPAIRRTYHRVLFGAAIRVPRELRASIEALPYVASVREDSVYQATWNNSSAFINAPQAWLQFGTRGAGVRVAVIDSGIDYTHPALGGGIGSGLKVMGGWDFVDDDADPMDVYGHGTHVAGIIAGNDAGITGVAPEASLLAYRALAGNSGFASDVIAAIERSVDPDQNDDPSDHVDVVNLSLGGPPQDDDPGMIAVENAAAAGIVFCIAAGNGSDYGNVTTPGISPSAITVGASDPKDAVASFSSRGPSLFYAIKPEVIAPGVSISSSYLNGTYTEMSGTSMATPQVAGVAALLKAVHPGWSPADIKSAIVTTSVPFDQDVMITGAGRVDALKAASTQTLVTPPAVSFGKVDATQTVWSVSSSVTLRNVSSNEQTLTATVRGLRDGVVVTVTPPSVTLAAGASATVQVSVSVTNAQVPAPEEGSLSYSGRIEWSGGAVPLHVPWAFVKGVLLAVTIPDGRMETMVQVLGSRKTRISGRFFGTTRVLWPIDTVDVVTVETPSPFADPPPPERIVVLEQIDTATTSQVTARMADALYTIAPFAADERGAPLANGNRDCKEQFILAFPSGRRFAREQVPSRRAAFSGFSPRVTLYTSVHCVDAATDTAYTAFLGAEPGLSGTFAPSLRSPWARHEVRLEGDPEFASLLYATVRLPGPESTWFLAEGKPLLLRPAPPVLTIYSAGGSSEADLVSTFSRDPFGVLCNAGNTVNSPEPCRNDSAFLYFRDEDARVDGDLYAEVSPMAYRAPAGAPLTLADGPWWGELGTINEGSYFRVFSNWSGPSNEKRLFMAPWPAATLKDAGGHPLGIETSDGNVVKPGGLAPGAYRAEAVNRQYTVEGIPGTSTVTALFDTRRPDSLAPRFTGMRVLDGEEQQTTTVPSGAAASFVVSVADLVRDGAVTRRVQPLEGATRIEYSRHGENQWRALTPVVVARQYLGTQTIHEGVGTMYRADLTSMARTVGGAIDLRVHAEDAAGNAVEILLQPALVVTGTPAPLPRRRAVGR
jgi:subtilisin family serine protease